MRGGDLPSGDQIVRYVKPSMIQKDGSVDGSDFRLRPGEAGLSVNWLEAFGPGKDHQLCEVRRLCRLKLRPNGRFAEMNVGTVERQVADELDALRIIHDPLEAEEEFDADPSHAKVVGLPPHESDQALAMGDLIAKCVVATHPALVEQDD